MNYLRNPVQAFGVPALLICLAIYQIMVDNQPYPLAYLVVIFLVLALVLGFLGVSRYSIYGVLALALIVFLAGNILVVANGKHDRQSTRDDAVELSTRALLDGNNPWRVDLGVPVTTGPSSILLAVPFVAIFEKINNLSLTFWLAFFSALFVIDLMVQNNSWAVLVALFLTGAFGVRHTLYWSLDELYFPILFITIAYWLTIKERWLWTGALLVASIMARPSYGFLVIAFGFWLIFERRLTFRKFGMTALGGILAFILIMLPFVILNGEDLISHNPWRPALSFTSMNWPDTNPIYQLLNRGVVKFGVPVMQSGKLGLFLLLMAATAWGLQRARVNHPFWHLTLAALLAHTLIWLPAHLPDDYILMILLPAMLGIAHQVEPKRVMGGNL